MRYGYGTILAGALWLLALPCAALAQAATLEDVQLWTQARDLGRLRAELTRQGSAKRAAGEAKTQAYRDANTLFKNCARELRAFCLLSAQTMMRTADISYREREAVEFPRLPAVARAVADLEAARQAPARPQ